MSANKTPQEQAEGLVEHCRYCGMPDYRPKCKADHEASVAAVAAALAAKEKEIERLRIAAQEMSVDDIEIHFAALEAEIAALREQLAVAQGMRDKAEWKINHDQTNHRWVCADVPGYNCIDERHTWKDEQWIDAARARIAKS